MSLRPNQFWTNLVICGHFFRIGSLLDALVIMCLGFFSRYINPILVVVSRIKRMKSNLVILAQFWLDLVILGHVGLDLVILGQFWLDLIFFGIFAFFSNKILVFCHMLDFLIIDSYRSFLFRFCVICSFWVCEQIWSYLVNFSQV